MMMYVNVNVFRKDGGGYEVDIKSELMRIMINFVTIYRWLKSLKL